MGERKTALHAHFERVAREQEAQRAEESLPDYDGQYDDHDGLPIGHKNGGIYQHAHADKENGTKEVLDGGYYALNAFCLDGFGQDTTHHKRTKGRRVAGFGGENYKEETQAYAYDE